ncbi:MAG: non-ribosomal peptide synthetase [Acidobacteriota bacterium]|nr:non-ribosomal peptide synthetase [Acidobacteriota bacterium]
MTPAGHAAPTIAATEGMATPSRDGMVPRLFEEQAARTPDAVAVELQEGRLTYGELNRRANQLARHLRGRGVGPEALVGVRVERSMEGVVALFAVLKAGGAYLPLDPTYPRERLRFMLEDSGAHSLLTDRPAGETGLSLTGRTIVLEDSRDASARESEDDLPNGVEPQHLAYVIYTSGSTGKPKGVEIEHGSFANHVRCAVRAFGIRGSDRFLQFASWSFDTSVQEIFSGLCGGATLVLRSDEMIETGASFLAECGRKRLTVLDLPTSYWHEIVAVGVAGGLSLPESLRLVVIGGEKARPERFDQWRRMAGDRIRLINAYGPTEATVAATFWEAGADAGESSTRTVPIGRPLENVQTYVLDGKLRAVPIGVVGDLHVGGAGVARGYRNRPDLTAEKFIRDPFGGAGRRLYRTGDRARVMPNGDLEYVGRVDGQIKIRGFRIEVGEVEVALRGIPAVREAVVRAREDVPGEARLVAYVMPEPESSPSVGELRRRLKELLPEHMVPSSFVLLAEMPKTASGKIDAAALPPPDEKRPNLDETYVPPRTPVERALVEIWTNVLRIDRIGIHDNFFDLGGDSLRSTQVAARAYDAFRIDLPVRDFFLSPTIASLAVALLARQIETVCATARENLLTMVADRHGAAADVHPDLESSAQGLASRIASFASEERAALERWLNDAISSDDERNGFPGRIHPLPRRWSS